MNFDTKHIAQLNIGRLAADLDDPRVAEFVQNIGKINALAKRIPGFVWMQEDESNPGRGNLDRPTSDDPRDLANMSVWENVETLENFVFGTVHKHFYAKRTQWFDAPNAAHFVMWPVPIGHRPSMAEGLARLEMLRSDGETERAFGWAYAREHAGVAARRCTMAEVA